MLATIPDRKKYGMKTRSGARAATVIVIRNDGGFIQTSRPTVKSVSLDGWSPKPF